MTKKYSLYLLTWTMVLLTGCQSQDMTEFEKDAVEVSLAFSVAEPAEQEVALTRMSDAVVQADGNYRGIDMVAMIPFAVKGKISSSDRALRMFNNATETSYLKNGQPYGAFYLYDAYTMMNGTASFLVYGKAKKASDDKHVNGSLVADIPANLLPADIKFSLEPICSLTEPPSHATLLADYLTSIANVSANVSGNTVKWSQTTDSWLKAVYLNFIGQENDKTTVLAGSAANVIAYVNALYEAVSSQTYVDGSEAYDLQQQIFSHIKTSQVTGLYATFDAGTQKVTRLSVNDLTVNYPASIGLPDGAAALQWVRSESDAKFVPQTQTTTTASINTITRYCYPSELYYYANSQIRTTDYDNWKAVDENGKTPYEVNTDWVDVLNKYEVDNGVINSNSKGAAIKEPMQYGVPRLQVTMVAENSQLSDNFGNTIDLSEKPDAFPLTGVIVCNQHPVGFDFKPEGTETHADDGFAYDTQVLKADDTPYYLGTTSQTIPSTLVLQTYDDEVVTVILEFRNDSGKTFHGVNGLIYPGTKFYLLGSIDPTDANASSSSSSVPADVKKRVFTQDYVTTVTVRAVSTDAVKSLANAYNVLPDVLGGRLEVGIELTPKWIEVTPTNVVLE